MPELQFLSRHDYLLWYLLAQFERIHNESLPADGSGKPLLMLYLQGSGDHWQSIQIHVCTIFFVNFSTFSAKYDSWQSKEFN